MSDRERTVWDILSFHVGRDYAIGGKELALIAGINERMLRDVIHKMRVDYHLPVGSAFGQPSGYFIADNKEELLEVFNMLKKFALKNILAAYRMYKPNIKDFIGKIKIDLLKELEG